ncbi:glycosyltransferase family 1 protein [Acinetobacter towneri]|uniref:glycosyltransferase family 1 protein n=1 Tax=Acinetobacter towneri TaxID=202956 RepID=UPI003215611C
MSKKVLHVLGRMDAGGVETWLVNLLKNTDRSLIEHDFLLLRSGKGFYDEEIIKNGGSLNYCTKNSNPLLFSLKLYKYLRQSKPDIVHSHVYTFSGLVLLIAFLANIKVRISHSHNDMLAKESKSSFIKKIYLKLMKKLIDIFATDKIAVSEFAAQSLYGENWKSKNIKIMPCTIDLSKFDKKYENKNLRAELGIPESALVLGHVGSFTEQKNHNFLIDVFFEVYKRNPNALLVLVGDGQLKPQIEEKVKKLGLSSSVLFLGLRKDVPILMMSVFDVFVFPSLWEGLGLVAVEAQSAGLLCIASKNVPKEADVGLCTYLNLNKSLWADSILSYHYLNKTLNNDKYDIKNSVILLSTIYSG